jgi:outer membrane protein
VEKMRYFSKIILFCLVLFAGGLSAQTLKFGHIDFQQLILVMPEREGATKALAKVQTDLDTQNATMQKEYQDKMKDYVAQQKTYTDAIRTTKEEELQSLNQRIQSFQQQAQETYSKEQEKLFQPIIEKARKAITDVGKEQGVLYVFEVNGLLYHSDQSVDLLPLVKTKLGIK